MNDPVLNTLMLPLESGAVALPAGPILYLRARAGLAADILPRDRTVCDQSFKPAHDALVRAGFTVTGPQSGYALSLVLPQRQRDENRALLARAVKATEDGGIVMAAQSNTQGAKTFQDELEALTGAVTSQSKNKCRVFWAQIDHRRVNSDFLESWLRNDEPQRNEAGYLSRPGLFAWDRIDPGSKLLAEHLSPELSGRAADLGAGFGYLSDAAFKLCPKLTHIDLYEAEQRALDLARENLGTYADRTDFHWADVTRGIDSGYDIVISNPPFHIDREDRSDLGQSFIRAAAAALKTGGQFVMVANRHLPYEETLKSAFKTVKMLADSGGYKVLIAKK